MGNDQEETYKQREFEKRFFSEATNQLFCKTFMENALRDPISGEFGKSIVFAVSQHHAAKLTQIFNEMAERLYPGKYQSDFAVQVTSQIDDAQQITINFVNNNLLGSANFLPTYKTRPQGDEYFVGGEAAFIRTSDVGAVHLSDNFVGSVNKVNAKALAELRPQLFPRGTILFPKSGASTFLNHRVVMGAPAYVSSHLACIICDESKALPKFVYHLLCRVDARDITPDQAYPSLRLSEIGAIQIPLPPLEVQKEIVAEIEGYQKVINGARAVLDHYRPQIPIHPDWPIRSVAEVASLRTGTTPDTTRTDYYVGDVNFVKTSEINNNIINCSITHISRQAVVTTVLPFSQKGLC